MICLVNAVCARDLEPPKQCQVRPIFDFLSVPLGRLTVFLISANYLFYAVTVCIKKKNVFIGYAVTVSNFSELFSCAATVFFLPELILHKYSVEG